MKNIAELYVRMCMLRHLLQTLSLINILHLHFYSKIFDSICYANVPQGLPTREVRKGNEAVMPVSGVFCRVAELQRM